MFHKAVDALHFFRDIDALRTMMHTLVAAGAMVCLPQTGDGAVVAHEESTASLTVVLRLLVFRNISLVDTFIVV